MKKSDLAAMLGGNVAALQFIEVLFDIAHFWDDLIDKDKGLSDEVINQMMWDALVTLPSNPFYRQFFDRLQPLVVNAIANWHAATQFERSGDSEKLELAFVIRSDYANILLQCVYLIGGRAEMLNAAPYVRSYWTEEDYKGYLANLQREHEQRDAANETGEH